MNVPTLILLVGAAVFGLVLSVWMIGVLLWQFRRSTRQRAIHQRLGLNASEVEGKSRLIHLWHDGKLMSTEVPVKARAGGRLREFRHAFDPNTPMSTVVLGLVGIMTASALAGLALTGSAIAALGIGVASLFPLWILAQQRIARKRRVFEQQLSDALAIATQSLRAGHPLLGAFRLISEEMDPPISETFAEILQLQSMGLSIEKAIERVSFGTPSDDMKLLGASIIIQTRSGGNLADMIDRLGEVIRDRMRLFRRARVLTAQTQLSKYILLAVPFFIFGILHVLNADYISPLYTTQIGRIMSMVSLTLLAVGTYIINRISILRY